MRKAVLFKLKSSEHMREYKRRHDSIWPEVLEAIKKSGIRNYSIWNFEDLLFGYYEIDSEEADKKAAEILFSEPKFIEWRSYMEDIINIDGNGQKEYPMQLMFLLE
ncbi:L-rhamnose mutarotase [Anaerobacterium chartisolvens]|uniref:L-rhamnose mutarotase n=1 Tax=Anaerobacterium chartisolvens TaxID=1297424 RepID=A0A369BE70_9FIRM|nr:L-rhamnose mutarotase [Anaerobacterium chartisolvens]RCX18777.1 L-rhamnose mutarotase [Anaerobacterium chartisolvens]